jgi:hypothetical protein
MKKRPKLYDTITHETTKVYGSFTPVNEKHWIGGLFAKRDIIAKEIIGRYQGKEYNVADGKKMMNVSDYMMSARIPRNMKRRKYIDGDPNKYPQNIVGLANFVADQFANAAFEDLAPKKKLTDPQSERTEVWLVAKENIAAGTEIRVDYNRDGNDSFYQMMKGRGVSDQALTSPAYKMVRWSYPTHKKQSLRKRQSKSKTSRKGS